MTGKENLIMEVQQQAILAAKAHQEAVEKSREAQMVAIVGKAITEMFAAEDSEGINRFVNIGRVPLICQSIIGIEKRLTTIEGNIVWAVRIILGAVILGLLTLLFK